MQVYIEISFRHPLWLYKSQVNKNTKRTSQDRLNCLIHLGAHYLCKGGGRKKEKKTHPFSFYHTEKSSKGILRRRCLFRLKIDVHYITSCSSARYPKVLSRAMCSIVITEEVKYMNQYCGNKDGEGVVPTTGLGSTASVIQRMLMFSGIIKRASLCLHCASAMLLHRPSNVTNVSLSASAPSSRALDWCGQQHRCIGTAAPVSAGPHRRLSRGMLGQCSERHQGR